MSDLKSHLAFKVVILLGILAMLGPIAHDIFVPAMPIIADGLNSTTNPVSISISHNVFELMCVPRDSTNKL